MVRCFVAIFPEEKIIEKSMEILKLIDTLPMKVKLVEPENLHISLSFLGEKSERQIREIIDKLEIISKGFHPFEVEFDGIEFIPNKSFIRVIAVKAESIDGETLRNKIVKFVGGSSHPLHLTLARVKNISNKPKVIDSLSKINISEKSTVNSFYLVKSQLMRSGPIYTPIKEFKLD